MLISAFVCTVTWAYTPPESQGPALVPGNDAMVPQNLPAMGVLPVYFRLPSSPGVEFEFVGTGLPWKAGILRPAQALPLGKLKIEVPKNSEGASTRVDTWTVVDPQPLPNTLGQLEVDRGHARIRIDQKQSAISAYAVVRLNPSPEAKPWLDALWFATRVDGQPWIPQSNPEYPAYSGPPDREDLQLPIPMGEDGIPLTGSPWGRGLDVIVRACEPALSGQGLVSGTQVEVQLEGWLPGESVPLKTPPTMIELTCDLPSPQGAVVERKRWNGRVVLAGSEATYPGVLVEHGVEVLAPHERLSKVAPREDALEVWSAEVSVERDNDTTHALLRPVQWYLTHGMETELPNTNTESAITALVCPSELPLRLRPRAVSSALVAWDAWDHQGAPFSVQPLRIEAECSWAWMPWHLYLAATCSGVLGLRWALRLWKVSSARRVEV